MKILLAEDDPNILNGLVELLEKEDYSCVPTRGGLEAIERFEAATPDFVLLDIMMPGMNGYDVCRRIRQSNATVPVVFISAKSEEIDKVVGLELGADDYIMKPFGVREVLARIRAITRRVMAARAPGEDSAPFTMGDLEVFPLELRARRGEQTMDLSLRDVKILSCLYRRVGQVVDRNTLFDECWGVDFMPNSRTLDQHISQLRKRVEVDAKCPVIVQTVRGAGYRYER